MFQFPRCPSHTGCVRMTARGFPHSEIPGSSAAGAYPGPIVACTVLHRHSAPRHPPSARKMAICLLIANRCCVTPVEVSEQHHHHTPGTSAVHRCAHHLLPNSVSLPRICGSDRMAAMWQKPTIACHIWLSRCNAGPQSDPASLGSQQLSVTATAEAWKEAQAMRLSPRDQADTYWAAEAAGRSDRPGSREASYRD